MATSNTHKKGKYIKVQPVNRLKKSKDGMKQKPESFNPELCLRDQLSLKTPQTAVGSDGSFTL